MGGVRRYSDTDLLAAGDLLIQMPPSTSHFRGQDAEIAMDHSAAQPEPPLDDSMTRARLAERMAALSTLSAGLGHDMGNLLLPIRLRLDSMSTKGVPPELKEDVEAIAACTDYLQRLANGLRLLSIDPRQADAAPALTNLAEWWPDAEPLLRNALPRGVELERSIPADLKAVAISRHLLTQAIFNLVQNAGHSIAPGTTGRVRVWAERAPGNGVINLGVTDNGTGMSAEVRARCLEPFFTSKSRGISTGLGLTLVHGIIHQAGGRIEITSSPGAGTTFMLALPGAESAEPTSPRPDRRAVVVLEDTRMRTYLGAVLRSGGFDVQYDDAPDDESDLLIADDSLSSAAIRSFLEAVPGRRCLVLGRRPDMSDQKGVVLMDKQPTPAMVRAAITGLASQFAPSRRTHEA